MKRSLLLLCGLTLFLGSCSTLSKTVNIANSINTDIIINPIVANVNLKEADKVEGTSAATYVLFFRVSGDNKTLQSPGGQFLGMQSRTAQVCNAAAYNAMGAGDYDILVHPRYTIDTQTHLLGLIKIYNVKVTGFGARITDMRQVKPGEEAYDALLYKGDGREITINPVK